MMQRTTERLEAVDSLRGIAILMVVAVHTSGFIAPSSTWLKELARSGPSGVQLFYIVSAFSLFLSYVNRQSAGQFSYREYFIRRAARIVPMFWLATVLYLFATGMGPRYWAPDGVTEADAVLTVLFLNGWSPTTVKSIVPGGWSIAVETAFYLVLPVCFATIRTFRAAVVATALTLVVRYIICTWVFNTTVPGFPDSQRYLPYTFAWEFLLPAQLPVFMLGIVLYFLRDRVREATALQQWCWLAVSTALVIGSQHVPAKFFFSNSFLAAAGYVLLSLVLFTGGARFLNNAPLRKVGEVSFSIYLLHHLVMDFCAGYVVRGLNYIGLGTTGDAAYLLTFAFVATASTTVAIAAYRIVEVPGIHLGTWITKRTAPAPESPLPHQP